MGLPRVLALPLLYLFSYALHVNALPRLSSFGRVGSKFDSSRKPGGLASERSFDLKNSNQLCLVTSAPLCLQTLEPLLRVRGGQGEVAQNQSAAPIALPEPETIPIPLPAPAAPASPPAPAAAPSPVKWRVVSFAAAAFAAILFAWPGEMKLDGVPVSAPSMAPCKTAVLPPPSVRSVTVHRRAHATLNIATASGNGLFAAPEARCWQREGRESEDHFRARRGAVRAAGDACARVLRRSAGLSDVLRRWIAKCLCVCVYVCVCARAKGCARGRGFVFVFVFVFVSPRVLSCCCVCVCVRRFFLFF